MLDLECGEPMQTLYSTLSQEVAAQWTLKVLFNSYHTAGAGILYGPFRGGRDAAAASASLELLGLWWEGEQASDWANKDFVGFGQVRCCTPQMGSVRALMSGVITEDTTLEGALWVRETVQSVKFMPRKGEGSQKLSSWVRGGPVWGPSQEQTLSWAQNPGSGCSLSLGWSPLQPVCLEWGQNVHSVLQDWVPASAICFQCILFVCSALEDGEPSLDRILKGPWGFCFGNDITGKNS